MITFAGRALFWLLCAMTAPQPASPAPPTVQPRPAPPPALGMCIVCRTQPQRAGTDYCGDGCQAIWIAGQNRAIPIPIQPMLPDGNPYRRTT